MIFGVLVPCCCFPPGYTVVRKTRLEANEVAEVLRWDPAAFHLSEILKLLPGFTPAKSPMYLLPCRPPSEAALAVPFKNGIAILITAVTFTSGRSHMPFSEHQQRQQCVAYHERKKRGATPKYSAFEKRDRVNEWA